MRKYFLIMSSIPHRGAFFNTVAEMTDLGQGERNDAVIIVDGILHQKPVGLRLPVQDRSFKAFPA